MSVSESNTDLFRFRHGHIKLSLNATDFVLTIIVKKLKN